ncbi:MAG: DUF1207 domain-containing protein [Chloroherpetonaceae bacterium]|nr:DUF1207 domain-containing protein [Chloroherpetonaceae bacterium]
MTHNSCISNAAKIAVLFIFLLFNPSFAQSQTLESKWRYELSSPLFRPLLADNKEPRIGVTNYLEGNQLLLDIGATTDLVEYETAKIYEGDTLLTTYAFGADFGTFSLLRKDPNFKFPVEAADYIFGFYLSFQRPLGDFFGEETYLSARLRVSHISAHLIDGSYDNTLGVWRNGEPPFVFSREFINLVLGYGSDLFRFYLGYEFLIHTIPNGFSAHSFQAGLEHLVPNLAGTGVSPFVAVDFKLTPVWRREIQMTQGLAGTTSVMIGAKTGDIGKRGIRLFYNYVGGNGWRGMYRTESVEYHSLGFIIDL